jgi:hypothetical protein
MNAKDYGVETVGRGNRVIRFPMVFTPKDVRQANWPQIRALMLENINHLFNDALDAVEKEYR